MVEGSSAYCIPMDIIGTFKGKMFPQSGVVVLICKLTNVVMRRKIFYESVPIISVYLKQEQRMQLMLLHTRFCNEMLLKAYFRI